MADYKDAIDVVPHKFYRSPLIISNADYKINVNGLDTFEASRVEENVTQEGVQDGTGILIVNPTQRTEFKFTTLASADTETDLWDLLESGEVFTISYTDPNSPKFNVSGKNCLFAGAPAIPRSGEKPMHEWTVRCVHGKMRGGAFTRAV